MLLAATGATGACGDDGYDIVPWPTEGPCWPIEAMPGAEVQIGTGDLAYQPMPDTLLLVKNASQADPFFRVHARVKGIPAGDPEDFFDPRNPRTRVGMVIEELGMSFGVECPASLGYIASPESGAFDLSSSLRIGLGEVPPAMVSGKQARVFVEVVGANRVYGRDEKLVTLMDPPGI